MIERYAIPTTICASHRADSDSDMTTIVSSYEEDVEVNVSVHIGPEQTLVAVPRSLPLTKFESFNQARDIFVPEFGTELHSLTLPTTRFLSPHHYEQVIPPNERWSDCILEEVTYGKWVSQLREAGTPSTTGTLKFCIDIMDAVPAVKAMARRMKQVKQNSTNHESPVLSRDATIPLLYITNAEQLPMITKALREKSESLDSQMKDLTAVIERQQTIVREQETIIASNQAMLDKTKAVRVEKAEHNKHDKKCMEHNKPTLSSSSQKEVFRRMERVQLGANNSARPVAKYSHDYYGWL